MILYPLKLEDIDECVALTTPCQADSTCHDLTPNYTCTCNSGYILGACGDAKFCACASKYL